MTDTGASARRAAGWGLGALGLFWALVIVAGWLQPGYRAGRDYVSALASEGAKAPALGVLALVAFGAAYLAAAFVLDRWVGTRLGAALLVGAGLLTWVVAFARIDCMGGAAYCGLTDPNGGALVAESGSRFGPHLHGWAVAASYALVALDMLWLAILWWRRGGRRLRSAASAAALVTSLATVPWWVASDSPGGAQRLWLAILTLWVVLVLARPLLDVPSPEVAADE